MLNDKDTICAIATPPGFGGIGIIRISGLNAVGILWRIFRPKHKEVVDIFQSHRLYYGNVVNPDTGEKVDEALAVLMRGPKTYTREDVAEINCHGGPAAVKKALELAVRAGARLAGPGEFTRRAFLNGRIDLTQAEAVMDIISASTELSLQAAVKQLSGGLKQKIDDVRASLAELLALTELSIDFPEEEVDYVPAEGLKKNGVLVREKLGALLSTYDEGRLLREGLKLAIVGAPNVGKSSLLNLLTKSERAIVTEIPGTTRDTVEELINLGGVPVRVIDTAGIRESQCPVEREGIKRSMAAMGEADLILLVLDGSREIEEQDPLILAEQLKNEDPLSFAEKKGSKENEAKNRIMVVINKADLPQKINLKVFGATFFQKGSEVRLSAKTGQGLETLTSRIRELILGPGRERAPEAAINLRHKQALEVADEALIRFVDGCDKNLSPEFLALELREALDAVGEVVGRTAPEDVLNLIFSKFCIGK
ncbi:MAG: tRNA uridine-5-carboxymethylaminomethyl(34) synthesis GTPase MnmE [Nitrospirota bacterium]